jgi:ActR/RegA family two-component response regulator
MARSRRILIVEDDDASRRGLRQLLTNAGYTVISARTFEEGKRAAAETAPDLLIADVRLGAFNGLQLLAAAPSPLATIIVSGFPDPVLEAEAVRLGAHYLTKPIDVGILLPLIEEKLLSAERRRVEGSTRRWDRNEVKGQVVAQIEGTSARVIDVSVGGLRFEIERDQPLPTSFTVTFAASDLALAAHLVWDIPRAGRRLCGAALSSGNADALHHWTALIDSLRTAGTDPLS